MSSGDVAVGAIPHSRPWITNEDKAAVARSLDSEMISEGGLSAEFERAIAEYHGARGAVAASTGTAALLLCLRAMGIGEGDEVVIPSYVCRSVWDAVRASGAMPVLCDVEADWCMSRATVAARVTARTRAVVVVHTFGIVADVEGIRDLGLLVVEDCCQAVGATSGAATAGTRGDASILSFHATKLLTTGEGGMVVTRSSPLLERLRTKKTGGEGLQERHHAPLSDLQAALGLSQLSRYPEFLERRIALAEVYFRELAELEDRLPHDLRGRSAFFRFPLRTDQGFEGLRAGFARDGIHVRRGVDALLHREVGLSPAGFPGSERCFATTLSIPLYPALTSQEQGRIISACLRLVGDR